MNMSVSKVEEGWLRADAMYARREQGNKEEQIMVFRYWKRRNAFQFLPTLGTLPYIPQGTKYLF